MTDHKHNILIIEDEMLLAMSTKFTLEDAGYRVSGISSTCEDALSLLEHEKPDLVLLDITLGGEEVGMDIAQRIRAVIDVPIVYMTGSTDAETLEAARRTMPAGILKKPAEDFKMLSVIKEAISNYR